MPLHLGGERKDGAAVELEPEAFRTHGVVLGMTGSGKTGLSLVLLEELVEAGVPIIAIDPKGDLANIGLVFAGLTAEEFAPWTPKGDDPAAISARCRSGLDKWGLGPDAARSLADKLSVGLYTPGSESGIPVDVLGALRRPTEATIADGEARRDLIRDTVTGLYNLIGRQSDPVKDPAHIVLSTIVEQAWLAGEDPDLATLLLKLVDPPFDKVGVFPLDRFLPPKARMDLAMSLNGVVAAPSFAPWTSGIPLDLDPLLRVGDRVPVSIFNLAHLDDTQRQFFVGLLLSRLLAWSRSQPGSDKLRALLFFDEVAGYLPPHPVNPPSKGPLLTLMKQARAVGLGVLLATQNPVDVDYKALSNAGTWLVGRLQTPQDRERVTKVVGRPGIDKIVEGLGKREFLLYQASGREPRTFASRHALCYLRGPFTRREVATFCASDLSRPPVGLGDTGASATPPGARPAPPPTASPAHPPAPAPPRETRSKTETDPNLLPAPPPLQRPQRFLDSRAIQGDWAVLRDHGAGAGNVRRPAILAEVHLRFEDARSGWVEDVDLSQVWFPLDDGLGMDAITVALDPRDFSDDPPSGCRYAPLPAWCDQEKELDKLKRKVVDDLYHREVRIRPVHRGLRLAADVGETPEEFRQRVQDAVDARIATEVGKLETRFANKIETAEGRIEDAQHKVEQLAGSIKSRQMEEVFNIGETVLSLFSGRRKSVSSALTRRRQTTGTERKLEQAEDKLARLETQTTELQDELETKCSAVRDEQNARLDQIEERPVRPKKKDIDVRFFGIVWVPTPE